jgi:HEPN domain-containing protein
MAASEKVSEYLALSRKYLQAAEILFKKENLEPALFNAIHALELSIKSALYTVSDEDITIHRVGGLFGKHFRTKVGDDVCRRINKILSRYNIPRYPIQHEMTHSEVKGVLKTVSKVVEETVPPLLE